MAARFAVNVENKMLLIFEMAQIWPHELVTGRTIDCLSLLESVLKGKEMDTFPVVLSGIF